MSTVKIKQNKWQQTAAHQELMQSLFEHAPEAIILADHQGYIFQANQQAEILFGYSGAEFEGMSIEQLLPERFRQQHLVHRANYLADPHLRPMGANLELFGLHKNGHTVPVDIMLNSAETAAGKFIIAIIRDLTLHKQAATMLRLQSQIVNNMAEGVNLVRAKDGLIVYTNPIFEQMFGYESAELIGRHVSLINAPDLHSPEEKAHQILQDLQLHGKWHGEIQNIKKDGTTFWCYANVSSFDHPEHGAVWLAVHRDITERKKMEEALHQSQRLFQNAFQTAPIGMCLVSVEGQFMRVNVSLCNMLGYDPETFLQLTFQEITHPDDLQQDMDLVTMLLRGEISSYEMEKRYIHQSGKFIWAMLNVALVHDIDGQPLYFISQIQDISEQKQMTLQLEQSQKQYQMLFEEAPVMYVTTRNEGGVPVITACNQAFLETLGYQKAEVIGKFLGSFYTAASRKILLENGYQEAMEGRLTSNQERDLVTHDGRIIHTVLQAIPLHDGETEAVIGTRAMFTDITDRRAMEQQLKVARETAENANRAKSQFLANMSHELRTPLNAILGFSQLMERDQNLTNEQRINLDIINRSGTYLLSLINDVLEITKIDAGKVELREDTFNIIALLDDLQNMFYAQAEQKQIGWRINVDSSVPTYLYGDEKKFYQILVNLIGNAIKFTDQGEVSINILEVRDTSQPLLECIVSDTGPGIAEQEISQLFLPFTQTTLGQESSQGSGLGLTIVKHYVQLMGGSIQVYSDINLDNSGTIFALHIPFKAVAQDQSTPPTPFTEQTIIGLAPEQPVKRILIVDDSNINRLLLSNLLQPLGLEIREAVNGLEAVQSWETWQPDLIFMDLVMPVMDGYEAIKQIRTNMTAANQTVLIAITANVFEETRQSILYIDVDDFISKPFKLRHIFQVLEKHLDLHFVYAQKDQLPDSSSAPTLFTPSSNNTKVIKNWSNEWEVEMLKELLKGDYARILELIDELAHHNPQLARRLKGYAEQFDYETIEELLKR